MGRVFHRRGVSPVRANQNLPRAYGAGVFAGRLGAIELAYGSGANEPGPHVLRLRILLGAAFQLERLLAAAKRALYFDVSAFAERPSEISELAEHQNAIPLGARFPFVRLFVLPPHS
jgi:hypothetical protein